MSEINKNEQLARLKKKQILVAMWGWEPEIMAPAAKNKGFDVVNQPQGNNITQHAIDIPIWANADLDMIVRPDLFSVTDPFDKNMVKSGLSELKKVIEFHEKNNPRVLAYVIQWGMFGEGGFEWEYNFTEKARNKFNTYMKTPGKKLPKAPEPGMPGSLNYIKWLEFRSMTLTDFRREFISFAKTLTNKLVGTWCEFYPVDNYVLNMGDAPGADFFFYDLSFGDMTTNQSIAFGESHGEMESYPTFDKWLKHELPLMAKAAGEGVTPIAFQFPMRKNHNEAENVVGKQQFSIVSINQEYSLKLGKHINELINATEYSDKKAEVILVYQSFQASALPVDSDNQIPGNNRIMPLFSYGVKQIESSLHQMGVNLKIIPYEWLGKHDLSQYKLVIIPDPLYLNNNMRLNLSKAKKVLYIGQYLVAHRNIKTEKGDFFKGFSAQTEDDKLGLIKYLRNSRGIIKIDNKNKLMKNIDFSDNVYPSDQVFQFNDNPKKSTVLASINNIPIIFTTKKSIYISNHLFNHAWSLDEDWLEKQLFIFLKNVLQDNNIDVPVISGPHVRANLSYEYGSYGISGNIGWNTTEKNISVLLKNKRKIHIPKQSWIKI